MHEVPMSGAGMLGVFPEGTLTSSLNTLKAA